MPFSSNMVDHPTIPIGEIRPSLVRCLNTSDPNGQIISIYRTDQPPKSEIAADSTTSLLLNFNGEDGSTIFSDTSGNNRTITTAGSPVITTADSKFGGASAYFDGSSYLTATIPGGLPESWTIEFWYKKTSDSGWLFNCRSGTGCNGVDIAHDLRMTTCNSTIISGANLELNRWYHVAFMRLNNSTVYRLVDGLLTGEGSTSNDMTTASLFYVGGSPTGNVGYLMGYIDDFRISNSTKYDQTQTLSDGQITASYHRPTREGQLIFAISYIDDRRAAKPYVSVAPQDSFWQYDELIMNMDGLENSKYFADHSTNNYSFARLNTARIVASTGISNNSSLYLDGVSSALILPSDPFQFGINDFTFEFWLNVETTQTNTGPYVFGSSPSNSGGGFVLYLPGPETVWGGTDRIYFQSSTGSSGPSLQSTSAFKGQGWKHVAITRSGSIFRLFVNGIQEASIDSALANYIGTTAVLGSSSSGSGAGTGWYKGYIDLLRVTKGACRYTANFTPPTSFDYLKWKPTAPAPTYINPATGQPYERNWFLYSNLAQ